MCIKGFRCLGRKKYFSKSYSSRHINRQKDIDYISTVKIFREPALLMVNVRNVLLVVKIDVLTTLKQDARY